MEEGWRGNQVLRMQSWLARSLLFRLLASASHLPLPPECVPPHLPLKTKTKAKNRVGFLGWPVSDQSDFGRHGLEVLSRTKLLVTRFLSSTTKTGPYSAVPISGTTLDPRNKLGGVAWQLVGCFFNIGGEETDPGHSWLQITLASGQRKQASSTLAGMGAVPGRWWVGG